MAFVNRYVANPPQFSSAASGGILKIVTATLTLTYQVGQSFSANSLAIISRAGVTPSFQWRYSQQQSSKNLLGKGARL